MTSEKLSPFTKRILIVDDDPDITFTFKKGFEAENEKNNNEHFSKFIRITIPYKHYQNLSQTFMI